jgi:hypothetical protein
MKPISIRLTKEMLDNIDMYAALTGIDRSKAIKELLRYGMVNRGLMELREKFQAFLNKKTSEMMDKTQHPIIPSMSSLITLRDEGKCQKCGSTSDIEIYHIDQNPINTNPSNLIVLCKICIQKAEKYKPRQRVTDDFLEWFFLL